MSTQTDKHGQLVADQFSWDNADAKTPVFSGWHDPSNRWNGWASPAFEKDEADRLMAYQQAHGGEDDETITYDAEQDAYVLTNPGWPDEPEMVRGMVGFCADGTMRHLYGIGAWAWTWSEVSEEQRDARAVIERAESQGYDGHSDARTLLEEAEAASEWMEEQMEQGDAESGPAIPAPREGNPVLGPVPTDLASAQRWLASALEVIGYRFDGDAEDDSEALVTGFHWDTSGGDYVASGGAPTFEADEAETYDRNRSAAFDLIEQHREDPYAFMGALLPCRDCGKLCYYGADDWYHHLDPTTPLCFLTSADPDVLA